MSLDAAFLSAYDTVSRAHKLSFSGGVGVYTLPSFSACAQIDHGFSARTGGVSKGECLSLNLSFTRPEPETRENVLENYRRFCRAANIPYERMVMDNYAHETTVLRVGNEDAGRGYLTEPLPSCDGLVTNDDGVVLITGHADCMPFFLFDPVTRSIGLAHAGWRGALGRIGASLVSALQTHYGANPRDMLAGVGPSICQDCFEVGENVAALFENAFPDIPLVLSHAGARPTVDLWMVAAKQFCEAGVPIERFSLMNVCTAETPILYSHRRDKGKTGGMSAYLRILPR